ncbi:membrane protein insertase YidC [Streptococcus pneumoniae]
MKKNNRILFAGLSLASILFLTGCVPVDKSGQPYGIFWDFFGKPMSWGIDYFANNQALGFGIAIILVTIIVRLIIFPLGIYQSWKAAYQSEKMNYLKPILEPFQDRLKTAETQEEKLAAQQALMAAQKENGVSVFGGVGCLPVLIQMPFFLGLFAAVRYTPGVAESSYLGIHLGSPSILLTVIVGALYYIQSMLMMVGIDESQKEIMKKTAYMTPIMMLIFSFSSPAGLTLYWVVGGLIQIIQQVVVNFLVRPRMKKQVAEEFAKNPPKAMSNSGRMKDVTPQMSSAIETNTKKNKKKNRNAGKQRSR